MNDDLKKKIEEVVDKVAFEEKGVALESVVDDLSTLYTEMVEGELRGFAKWYENRGHEYDGLNVLGCVEQYLVERNK